MSIKSVVRSALKSWLDGDGSSQGASVVSGAGGVLSIERSGERCRALLAGMSGSVGKAVLVVGGGGQAQLEVDLHGQVVHMSEGMLADQTKLFDEWVKRFSKMTKGSKTGGGLFKWALLLSAVLMFMLWFGMQAQQQGMQTAGAAAAAKGSAAAPSGSSSRTMQDLISKVQNESAPPRSTAVPMTMPGGLPQASDEDRIYPIAALNAAQLGQLKTATMLSMKPEGKPFYVFSNPTCGACQHLEGELEGLKSGDKPIVIPVAFDAEGMERGTQVMCSKDPVAAWKKMMKGEAVDTPLCAEGLKKMGENSNLFASMGFQATPTLIAGDGRGAIGSVSSGVLAKWLGSKE